MSRFSKFGVALLATLGIILSGTQAQAFVPIEKPTAVPNATGLMGSKPPEGDPLTMGKRIAGTKPLNAARSISPQVPAAKKRLGPAYYKYTTGKQTPATPPSGVSDTCTVSKPYINPTYDYHTLCEIAVQSADEQQIVEIGWTRDQATFGDNLVHLFAYHWINGNPTCYGCGFVDYAPNTTYTHGSSLEGILQTDKVFAIERTANAWWLGFDGQWIGSFPDTEWTMATPPVTNFKQVNLAQFFGELAAGSDTASCADIGLGPTMVPASPTAGAKIRSTTFTGQATTAVNLAVGSTDTHWMTAYYSGSGNPGNNNTRGFNFGGGGYC